MQGQIHNGLNLPHSPGQNRRLVQLRQTHIHIQNVRTGLLLGDGLPEDGIQISLPQRLGKGLSAGRVDALANDYRGFVQPDTVGVGADAADVFGLHRLGGHPLTGIGEGGNIGRGGAAAASGDGHALIHQCSNLTGEFLRGHIIESLAVHHLRQSGVGLQQHRHGGVSQIFLHHRGQSLGPQGAVDADGIGSHALQHGHHGGGVGARHQLAVGAVGVGDEHRQRGVLLCRQQGGLGLVAVGHSLNEDQVGSIFYTQTDGFGEDFHGILKVQIAVGGQHFPRGANVQCHPFLRRRGTLSRGSPGIFQRRADNLLQFRIGKLQTVGSEGVGVHHMGSGVKILLMDLGNHLRVGEIPSLRQFPGLHSPGEEQRTHAPVQKQQVLGHIFQNVHRFHPSLTPMTAVTDLLGVINRLLLRVRPMLPQSSAAKISRWQSSGKSPYPGLNRGAMDFS